MSRITFLGLGAMGRRMADKLVETPHQLVVFNRSPGPTAPLVERGATVANSPREAAKDADVVISMVTDDDASRQVWLDETDGALRSIGPKTIAIECSTLTPAWIQALGRQVARAGVGLLDAPVVGTRPQAQAGQLVFLVGGASETLAEVQPILMAMGSTVHHIGPAGSGALMKLAVNALFGIQVAALGEVLGLLQKGGIAVDPAVEVLGSMAVTSPALRGVAQLIAANR